jgi:hypothetical protein
VLLVDPAPPIAFELVTLPPEIDRERHREIGMKDPRDLTSLEIVLGRIVVPAGSGEGSFELRMPPARH